MDEDYFNEYPSEDGSGEGRRQSVAVSRAHFRDSSSSPMCSTSDNLATTSRMNRITNEIYHEKYRKLKRIAKGLVFENACLCDEVSQLQEKIVIAKEERRLLLRKLLTFQAQKEKDANVVNVPTCALPIIPPGIKPLIVENLEAAQPKKKNPVKKKAPPKNPDEVSKPRSKKKKVVPEKRFVQPIPLDCSGRPIFPIVLGALTVHSLGSIIHDRPVFHDEHNILPVGFCSSRTYISLKNPSYHCLYTCTILDGPFGPRFEITPDDNHDHPIIGTTLNECHSILLKAINSVHGKELLCTDGQGAKFFGLSHPIIQNLIQSCPGARKCSNYRWIHFEVNKPGDEDDKKFKQDIDPSIDYIMLRTLITESSQQCG